MSKPVIKRTYVHWRGSFVAIGGTVWEVEILRPEKVLTPVELDFPADEPLIIEWDDITPESTAHVTSLGSSRGPFPGNRVSATSSFSSATSMSARPVRRSSTFRISSWDCHWR